MNETIDSKFVARKLNIDNDQSNANYTEAIILNADYTIIQKF